MNRLKDDSIRTLVGHVEGVTSVDIASDGFTALSASWLTPNLIGSVKQWDVTTGQQISVEGLSAFRANSGDTQAHGPFTSIAYAPSGRAALISMFTELFLTHAPTGEYQTLAGHSGPILSVAFAPDGRTALSASSDKTLKFWDLTSAKEIRTLDGFAHGISAMDFDGRYALFGDNEILNLWNVATGEEIETYSGHSSVINSVALGRGAAMWTALSGSADGTLKLWKVDGGKELLNLEGHSSEVMAVAFAPDGRTALSGSRDGVLKLWDLSCGQEIRTLVGHSDWISCLAFSPDGRTAISGSQDKTLKLWDVS